VQAAHFEDTFKKLDRQMDLQLGKFNMLGYLADRLLIIRKLQHKIAMTKSEVKDLQANACPDYT